MMQMFASFMKFNFTHVIGGFCTFSQLYRQSNAIVKHGSIVIPLIITVNVHVHQEKSMLNPHTLITLCDFTLKGGLEDIK